MHGPEEMVNALDTMRQNATRLMVMKRLSSPFYFDVVD